MSILSPVLWVVFVRTPANRVAIVRRWMNRWPSTPWSGFWVTGPLSRAWRWSGWKVFPLEVWIGVVGAGPSGLSFAYQMARRGYRVTIYESRAQAGGMLRYGVPDYRLPQEVLDAEIQRILDLGVDLKLNMAVGRDISLEALRARHTRTCILESVRRWGARSAYRVRQDRSVWTGTDFLSRINCGEEIEVGAARCRSRWRKHGHGRGPGCATQRR